MNSDEYKKTCNQPSVFSRGDLEITEKILRKRKSSVALKIANILKTFPIIKPDNHKGDEQTDYFRVNLSESSADEIIDIFTNLEASTIKTDGKSTPITRIYSETADKWIRYLSYQ